MLFGARLNNNMLNFRLIEGRNVKNRNYTNIDKANLSLSLKPKHNAKKADAGCALDTKKTLVLWSVNFSATLEILGTKIATVREAVHRASVSSF